MSFKKTQDYPTMNLRNNRWLNADAQACIEPPPIPLIRLTSEKLEECNIIKIKMRRDPASATSKTYDLKFQTFENVKPEEFLQMMKDSKTATEEMGTTSATRKSNSYVLCYSGKL